MKKCGNCGSEFSEEQNSCPNCGHEITIANIDNNISNKNESKKSFHIKRT